jgi:hypothetical protein
MKAIIIFSFLFGMLLNCTAQRKTAAGNSNFSTGLKQIKESANFGLVFTGPNVNYGHYWASLKNNRIFSIENELGVCIPFSKGIPALNVYLKPAEISWLFNNISAQNSFSLGPLVKIEYDYTLYPQLQSGFDYWYTNISLGVNSVYSFLLANQLLNARLKFSICGFTSRQDDYRNPYFYDIGFIHAIRHLNSNLEFSGPDKFNSTNFELSWKCKPNSRFAWTYRFDYSGYFEKPAISMVNHNIKVTITQKKKS